MLFYRHRVQTMLLMRVRRQASLLPVMTMRGVISVAAWPSSRRAGTHPRTKTQFPTTASFQAADVRNRTTLALSRRGNVYRSICRTDACNILVVGDLSPWISFGMMTFKGGRYVLT